MAVIDPLPGSLPFDRAAFEQSLAAGQPALPLCKAAISTFTDWLYEQFDDNADIRGLIAARARFIDELLRGLWATTDWGEHEPTLIAVGGYGRGELHPHSDIDLLFLLPLGEQCCTQTLEGFLTLLWDIGLDIGHSVRTIAECVEQAQDLTVVTNLMESRLLCGPEQPLEELREQLAPEHLWSSAEFFQAKIAERRSRHAKFADNEYNLEPNVKSSPGGLRDLQLIGWVAQRHFGITHLEELESDQFLNAEEMDILTTGRDYMWRTRFALHMLTGREEDRLLFDHQRELAKRSGFVDGDRLAVEQFMQGYYRWAQALAQLSEVLLQNFDQAILHADDDEPVRHLDDDFQLCKGYIDARETDLFTRKPNALLRIFLVCGTNEDVRGIGAPTIRLIRDHRHLIDDAFRADPENQQTFLAILNAPYRMARQLRRMNRAGILGKYLPEFGKIVGQMQHDLFHTYTVDAHTLEVVRYMRRFDFDDFDNQFPITCRIARRLPKKGLLYIAGLYHDIGKGRGGDHSELGAVDAREFCERHGLNAVDTNLVVWLVRNHLLMSTVAQRKDISDPEVIQAFATHVSDQNRLDYLLTMTVADINATNPTLWNAWRGSLLRQLYKETSRALRRGLDNPVDKGELIDAKRVSALSLLEDRGFLEDEVETLWEGSGDDYFLREDPEDIAWHTEAVAGHRDPDQPLVLVRPGSEERFGGATQIFVHTLARPHLFSVVCAELEQLDLSIHDARIYNSATGMSLDTFFVMDSDGETISADSHRLQRIADHLTAALSATEDHGEIISRRTPRQMKSFAIPTVTELSIDIEKQVSVLEVATPDRPGLLARIGQVFIRHGIELQAAKIQTLGERVEDVFFITDAGNGPISDPAVAEAIQRDICEILDAQAAA